MTNGPIEFLGEVAAEKLDHTEYGGGPGLIQEGIDPLGGEGHALTSSEALGVLVRAGNVPLASDVALSGEDPDQFVVDPVTGRTLDADMNKPVAGGDLTDLPETLGGTEVK